VPYDHFRSHGYYAVVDLIHHLRSELEPAQLARFAILYLGLTHNPNLTISTHILGAKMAFNSVDIIVMKHTKQSATRVLLAMIETSVDKLESMLLVHQELLDRTERSKNDEQDIPDMITIEKARPVSAAAFAVEKADTVFAGSYLTYKPLI
jgi:transformation/transcription domain-associated protein